MYHRFFLIFLLFISIIILEVESLEAGSIINKTFRIQDEQGDEIPIEVKTEEQIAMLDSLLDNGEMVWLGGKIEEYIFSGEWDWEFHFVSDSVEVLYEDPAEEEQATLEDIQDNLSQWLENGRAYIYITVQEVISATEATTWGRIKAFYGNNKYYKYKYKKN